MMKISFKEYVTALLISSLSSLNLNAGNSTYLQRSNYLSNEAKDHFLRVYGLAKILDPKGTFEKIKDLDPIVDSLKIENIWKGLENIKDLETRLDTPEINEFMNIVMKRWDYCERVYGKNLFMLGGRLDERVAPVIINGPPDEVFEEDNKYYMYWINGDIRLGFKDHDRDGKMERTIPHKDFQGLGLLLATTNKSDQEFRHVTNAKPRINTLDDIKKALKGSSLSVLSFYNPLNQNYTTYINTGISGEKIKDNIDTTKFSYGIYVYDEIGNIISQDSSNHNVLSKNLDKGSWIPFYKSVNNLPKKSVISVKVSKEKKDGKIADILKMNHVLPSGSLSDIALSKYKIEKDNLKSLNRGIQRNGYVIKENPSSTFSLDDLIYTYQEVNNIAPDSSKNYPYQINYSLVPLPEDKGRKGEVILGPLEVIGIDLEDSTKHKLEKLVQEGNVSDTIKSFPNATHVYVKSKVSNKPFDYINEELKIPSGTKPGTYALVSIVNDSNENVSKVAYRIIHLKKGSQSS